MFKRWGRRAAAFLRRRLEPRGVILGYHRVAHLTSDPWGIAVHPKHFAEHMEVLRRHYIVLPVQEFLKRITSVTLPDRAVAITFDDGYADNLHQALPVLERYRFPATMFLSTGQLDAPHEYWWDALEASVLGAPAERSTWKIWEPAPTTRHHTLQTLYAERSMSDGALATELHRQLTPRPNYRVLTSKDVERLAASPLIEIGSHTVSHAALGKLTLHEQQQQLEESKARLESLLNIEIAGIAYPFGTKPFYSAETTQIAAQSGYRYGCSFRCGSVYPQSDPMDLPRCGVADWDGAEFHNQLERWFNRPPGFYDEQS